MSQVTFYDLYPSNYSLIQKLQKRIKSYGMLFLVTYTIINILMMHNKMMMHNF